MFLNNASEHNEALKAIDALQKRRQKIPSLPKNAIVLCQPEDSLLFKKLRLCGMEIGMKSILR